MPACDFSEFAFGFAFTHEVITQIKADLDTAPGIPNQNEEGVLGYDLRLKEVEGWTFIAQYKIPMEMTRSNATEWDTWGAPYLRFGTRPPSARQDFGQHELLLALEAASVFNMVQYVAPCFSRFKAFNQAFVASEVERRSIKLRPSEIGPGDHVVTYDATGNYIVFSEPESGVVDLGARAVRNLGGFAEAERPKARRLDESHFRSVEERLLTMVDDRIGNDFRGFLQGLNERRRASTGDRDEAIEAFEDLSAVVRLVTGGQLFAVPAQLPIDH